MVNKMRLIDANALEKEWCSGCQYEKNKYANCIDCALAHAPTVEPKRKKGEWILLDDCSNSGYYCSNCQKKVVREGWSKTVKKINYCPNCGSDNRGEQDDEMGS